MKFRSASRARWSVPLGFALSAFASPSDVRAQTFFAPPPSTSTHPPTPPGSSAGGRAATAPSAPAPSAPASPASAPSATAPPATPASATAPSASAPSASAPSASAPPKSVTTTTSTTTTTAAPTFPTLPSASAAATGAACSEDQVSSLIAGLSDWARHFDEHAKAVAAERSCDRPDVLCLDRFGQLLSDSLPDRAVAGQTFTVDVIVPAPDHGRFAVAQSVRGKAAVAAGPFEEGPVESSGAQAAPRPTPSCEFTPAQRDAAHAAAKTLADLASRPGLEELEVPAGSWNDSYWSAAGAYVEWNAWLNAHGNKVPKFVAVESKVEVPAAELSYNIDFTRIDRGRTSPSAEEHYALWIDNGRYHIEAAVLVPFVFRGKRRATLSPTPSGSELRVGLDEDWHVTGALAFDVFPFGRQRGQVSSFQHCKDRSCFANWLGVQVGTGFDQPLEEWYFGLVFEPVSGLAISAGASLLKGDFLPGGLPEGILLPSSSAFSVSSDYMVRPYFGVTITPDILETLDRAAIVSRIR